jgi:DNA-binding NarL/FixJ family response regulator
VTLTLLDQPDSTVPGERRRGGAEVGWGGSPPEAAASASRPAEAAARSLRVLVVDDNARMRGELRALLEDGGFTVVGEASHGAEGVTLARELRPNVVVMDLRMPILDGIAATGYLSRELPDTQVIVFSAFEDAHLERAAQAAGASRFLTKGASPAAIVAAVRNAASA